MCFNSPQMYSMCSHPTPCVQPTSLQIKGKKGKGVKINIPTPSSKTVFWRTWDLSGISVPSNPLRSLEGVLRPFPHPHYCAEADLAQGAGGDDPVQMSRLQTAEFSFTKLVGLPAWLPSPKTACLSITPCAFRYAFGAISLKPMAEEKEVGKKNKK